MAAGSVRSEVDMEARLAAATAAVALMADMEATGEVTIPVEQGICAVTCGVRIHCVSVWEAIFVHAYK